MHNNTLPKMNMTYNGWANYNTWNVALWIGGDEGLYGIARACRRSSHPYRDFVDYMSDLGIAGTSDDVRWDAPDLDLTELNECIREL